VKGNQKKQRLFFDKYYPLAYKTCYKYLQNQMITEDAVLKGFTQIFNSLETFKYSSESALTAWVKKIMLNCALEEVRKKEFSIIKATDEETKNIPVETVDKISENEIIQMVNELDIKYREVFHLYVSEGYKHKEISELLKISESTSKIRLLRARKILQKKISIERYERI